LSWYATGEDREKLWHCSVQALVYHWQLNNTYKRFS
jgi:hypothetical protein